MYRKTELLTRFLNAPSHAPTGAWPCSSDTCTWVLAGFWIITQKRQSASAVASTRCWTWIGLVPEVRIPEMEHTALITRAHLRRRKKEAIPSLLALERLADRTDKKLQLL